MIIASVAVAGAVVAGAAIGSAIAERQKINQEEAEEVLNIAIVDISTARKAVLMLLDKGVQNVALSMGEKGLVFGNSEGIIHFDIPTGIVAKKTIG